MLALGAPNFAMPPHPFGECALETDVVSCSLALNPFVSANFLSLGEEFLVVIRF